MVRQGKTYAELAAPTVLALLACWVLAAGAQATIVPQQGMAGVKLGMSKSEVRDKLGKPRDISRGRNDFGRYTIYRFNHAVRVFFQSGSTVTSIRTTSGHERTKDGIGVGSSEQAVRGKLPKVTCRTLVKNRSCYLGELMPGRRVTEFQIKSGQVAWVSIGFLID